MSVVDPHLSWQDLLTMPDDGRRHEILEGELYMGPSPGHRHQRIVSHLDLLFQRFAGANRGEGVIAPFDVVLSQHTVFQPDALFARTENLSIITERGVMGAPDLVVEVLSDSTRDFDQGAKLRAYLSHGVREVWIVDPGLDSDGSVTVYRPEEPSMVLHPGDMLQSAVLDSGVAVAEILADAP